MTSMPVGRDDSWPAGSLFHSPRGLYAFQADGVARSYLQMEHGGGMLCTFQTGMGKSVYALALGALLFEDDQIDLMMIVAEAQKITDDEWPKDIEKFTRLTWARHHGTGRMQRLLKSGLPQVLVTTYETGKADLVKWVKKPGKRGVSATDGPLLPLLEGKRILVVFDESGKVKNRSSGNYKSWFRTLERLRKQTTVRAVGLSATPIEKDYEDAFNQLRLLDPKSMILVGQFEDYFIKSRDPYGRPSYHQDRMYEFSEIARPMILHKRKTDPDVIAEFPKQVEESRWFEMAEDQRDLYEMVCDLQDPGEDPVPGLHMIKRMIVNHPASIIHSAKHGTSALSRMLVEELGEDYFRSVSSVKTQGLIDYVKPIVTGQGDKVVIFSFFGPSTLPLLATALRKEKIKVYSTVGISLAEVSRQRTMFRSDPEPAVLLSSDAGARGVNLPEANYVIEYESALTYANRTQRINRCHRIDSESASVTCMTFFVHETIEELIAHTMIERNRQHEVLLDDDDPGEEYLTTLERKRALQITTRKPRRGR